MGKDDITGEDLIQRVDDQPATVRKRLEKYETVSSFLKKTNSWFQLYEFFLFLNKNCILIIRT